MGWSASDVACAHFGEFQAAFHGWQISQGIEREDARGAFDRSTLDALMAKLPKEAVH